MINEWYCFLINYLVSSGHEWLNSFHKLKNRNPLVRRSLSSLKYCLEKLFIRKFLTVISQLQQTNQRFSNHPNINLFIVFFLSMFFKNLFHRIVFNQLVFLFFIHLTQLRSYFFAKCLWMSHITEKYSFGTKVSKRAKF